MMSGMRILAEAAVAGAGREGGASLAPRAGGAWSGVGVAPGPSGIAERSRGWARSGTGVAANCARVSGARASPAGSRGGDMGGSPGAVPAGCGGIEGRAPSWAKRMGRIAPDVGSASSAVACVSACRRAPSSARGRPGEGKLSSSLTRQASSKARRPPQSGARRHAAMRSAGGWGPREGALPATGGP